MLKKLDRFLFIYSLHDIKRYIALKLILNTILFSLAANLQAHEMLEELCNALAFNNKPRVLQILENNELTSQLIARAPLKSLEDIKTSADCIHIAAYLGLIGPLKKLQETGLDINQPDTQGATVVSYAWYSLNTSILKELKKMGASFESINHELAHFSLDFLNNNPDDLFKFINYLIALNISLDPHDLKEIVTYYYLNNIFPLPTPNKLRKINTFLASEQRNKIFKKITLPLQLLSNYLLDLNMNKQIRTATNKSPLFLPKFYWFIASDSTHNLKDFFKIIIADKEPQSALECESTNRIIESCFNRNLTPLSHKESHIAFHSKKTLQKTINTFLPNFIFPTTYTPLMLAIGQNKKEVVQELLSLALTKGTRNFSINYKPVALDQANELGDTPLSIAHNNGHTEISQLLYNYLKPERALLNQRLEKYFKKNIPEEINVIIAEYIYGPVLR